MDEMLTDAQFLRSVADTLGGGRSAIRLHGIANRIGMEQALYELRGMGWMVAVHNDYRERGVLKTFWLLTHPASGRFVKGEGDDDTTALKAALRDVLLVECGAPTKGQEPNGTV